jgi:hypothetical protein
LCCTLALIPPPHIRRPALLPGLRCTLGPRMDFQFLSAPLAGIPLSSISLRRYLTGTGLALAFTPLRGLDFPARQGLTRFRSLVCSRERTRKQPGLPGTQPPAAPYVANAPLVRRGRWARE